MVCYALRCALRVVHLTKPDPGLHKKANACLEPATRFCTASSVDDIHDAARTAHFAAGHAAHIGAASPAGYASNAASGSAAAAGYAAFADHTRDADDAVTVARAAALAADCAAEAATDRVAAIAAVRADFEKLLELTGRQAGKIGVPMDPGEDGPLGPL